MDTQLPNSVPGLTITFTGQTAQNFAIQQQSGGNKDKKGEQGHPGKNSSLYIFHPKDAPHLKPLHGWRRWLSYFEGGRDENGIHYDEDGNPLRVSYIKNEMPWYVSGPGDIEGTVEAIEGYLVRSTVAFKGATYTRTISNLVATEDAKGLKSLLDALEKSARAQGASTIVLRGTYVVNSGFTATRAARFGYTFKQIDDLTFEITKALK